MTGEPSERPEDTSQLPAGISPTVSWWHVGLWLPSISRVVRQEVTSRLDGWRRRRHSRVQQHQNIKPNQKSGFGESGRTGLLTLNAFYFNSSWFYLLYKPLLITILFPLSCPHMNIYFSFISSPNSQPHTHKNWSACSQKNWIKRTRSRSLHRSLPTGPEREAERERERLINKERTTPIMRNSETEVGETE